MSQQKPDGTPSDSSTLPPIQTKFYCRICNKPYKLQRNLRNHINDKHREFSSDLSPSTQQASPSATHLESPTEHQQTPSGINETPPVELISVIGESVVLALESLSKEEKLTVNSVCQKLGGVCQKQVTDQTTHLVVKRVPDSDSGGIWMCKRTVKYLEAVSKGLWIVDFAWVKECAKLGRRAHEADFEIEGETMFGLSHRGPARARQRRRTGEDLLRFCVFHCAEKFDHRSDRAGIEVIWRLVKNAGGIYVQNRENFKMDCYGNRRRIILANEDFSPDARKLADECCLPLLRVEWLYDSVSRSELLPRKDYCIYIDEKSQPDLDTTILSA
ncbi:breast cancer type 1 susceptibility protein homolog [Symsagittifera roscoffensis]|uniref:breast cancer type 1 susceptibility protein homolog n=1 Tax=Symsagittifera roscoffensis TaxID=84072 RepID=UPI00307B589C